MVPLVVKLLGEFSVTRQGNLLTKFYSDKVRALLAYLVVEAEQSHSRAKIAGLLWPEQDETKARQNLRQALAQLRKSLREKENPIPYILANQQTIRWNPESPYALDVSAFEQAMETSNGAATALKWYQGDFLDGFFVDDSAAFEDWMLIQREQLRHDALAAFEMAVAQHEYQEEYAEAQRLALRWRAIDPLQEDVYQALMRCALAQDDPNQTLAYYERCVEVLSTEMGVPPNGETVALRDKARLQSGQVTGAESSQSPLFQQPPLPTPPTPFIGRIQELIEIDSQLSDPACRLLNLVGLGGMGKTRLALEAAQRQIVADAFAHGVYWVSLAGADSILPALISAIGLEMPTTTALQDHLATYLASRDVLLVLDNVEHLTAEANALAHLLEAAPKVKMLCTSRVRLSVQAEWLWDVGGLSLPTNLSDLDSSEAYQLFIQSARRVQANFNPKGADQEHIAQICQMVDGHPLSIALAAAWVRILSCQEIQAEIATGLDLLASEESDVAERHRSIQVIFDHTWQTLTPQEQEGLRQLSVFSRQFSRQATAQVANVSTLVLLKLVDRSLVQLQEEFFTLHPVIRHYAAGKLAQAQEVEHQLHSAHSRYHLNFLVQQLGQPRGAEQSQAQRYVRNLLDDIHQAWRWALAEQQRDALMSALGSLHTFYETSGWYQIGADEFRQATVAITNWSSDRLSDGFSGGPVHEPPKRTESTANHTDQLQGCLLAREAALRYRLGELTPAYAMLEKALKLVEDSTVEDSDNVEEVAYIQRWLGTVLYELGRYDEAEAHLLTSRQIYEQTQNQQGMANVLRELGDLLYFVKGEPEEALPLYERSLVAARRAQDRTAEIVVLLNHACVLISIDRYDQAEELLLDSLRMSRELGAKRLTGVALNNLAIVAYVDDPAKAQKLTEENYEIRVAIGDKLGQANCMRHMAQSAGEQGEVNKMLELGERAYQIYREIENQRGIISGLNLRAQAHAQLGNLSKAQELLARAISESVLLESTSAWISTAISGLQLSIVQDDTDRTLLLAGYILHSPAAHSYDRQSTEEALGKLRRRESFTIATVDEPLLLGYGAKASISEIQGWLEEISKEPNIRFQTELSIVI
ncbi:MAG: tetratricopeptide repeat protein [Chloroflexota bacterium]